MIVNIKTNSAEETEDLARILGRNLKGSECIEFMSDLGGGKTTFVRGLVDGAGSTDHVSSPTFTISQKYNCEKFHVYHFDFYRLPEPGLVKEELSEIVEGKQSVIVVEWAESVQGVLPASRIVISINKANDDENSRNIVIEAPEALGHMLEGVR